MKAENLKQELLGLERRFWQAMQDSDAEAAIKLTADPCIITGAQGVARIDKKQFKAMMANPGWTLKNFDLMDAEVERLSDDVAVIGYKVRENLIVDDQPMTIEAADASTWIRQNGSWVCALHTEALLGDPFGRDRTAKA
jgi:hypothetical protein